MNVKNIKHNDIKLSIQKHDATTNAALLEVYRPYMLSSLDALITVNSHLENYSHNTKTPELLINHNSSTSNDNNSGSSYPNALTSEFGTSTMSSFE